MEENSKGHTCMEKGYQWINSKMAQGKVMAFFFFFFWGVCFCLDRYVKAKNAPGKGRQ